MPHVTQPVSINGIEFDALLSVNRGLEATVPQYPVEEGYSVSDAVLLGAESLSMTLLLSPTPVTWHSRHGSGIGRVDAAIKQLEALYFTRSPVSVSTAQSSYSEMAIENLAINRREELGATVEIQISFKKIRVTTAATTTIPEAYGRSGATKAAVGTANLSAASAGGGTFVSGSTAADAKAASPTSSGDGAASSGSSFAEGAGGDSRSSILYGAARSLGLLS